jgi:hypothetical protein
VDDLFRGLTPYLLTEYKNASIAMPLIGSGDQGYGPVLMLESIVRTAISWIGRGLRMRLLKIVVFYRDFAQSAKETFERIQKENSLGTERLDQISSSAKAKGGATSPGESDVFLSYSHQDLEFANLLIATVTNACPRARVFYDRKTLKPGSSWLAQVAL